MPEEAQLGAWCSGEQRSQALPEGWKKVLLGWVASLCLLHSSSGSLPPSTATCQVIEVRVVGKKFPMVVLVHLAGPDKQ